MTSKVMPYIIVVLLVITVYLLVDKMNKMQENNERLLFNLEQSIDSSNTEMLKLTKAEIKQFYSDTLLTALMDSFNFKFRNIGRIHNEKYVYSYDTTIHLIQTNNDSIWTFQHRFDGCVSVDGYVDVFNKDLLMRMKFHIVVI